MKRFAIVAIAVSFSVMLSGSEKIKDTGPTCGPVESCEILAADKREACESDSLPKDSNELHSCIGAMEVAQCAEAESRSLARCRVDCTDSKPEYYSCVADAYEKASSCYWLCENGTEPCLAQFKEDEEECYNDLQ